ncbi:MAG: amidase [Acidobacteria bacterium]|nr:amidase [Acidobacteriota bacterium]
MTIAEFGRQLRAGAITAEQATDACLRRIGSDNGRLNAFILVLDEAARAQAREADRELATGRDRGPLHGVPISLKDLLDLKGTPTTAASRVREGHRAVRDAPAVAHLRRAGAVFVGKTNLHEFALGTTNEDSAFGPVRNPLDPSRSPGGSSGGSAVSVATGMALGTVGSDTGGSIRIPAAACGLVGLKPELGEVSAIGTVPLSRTFDHIGPLASTVLDAWLIHRGLMGEIPRPPAPRPLAGLRLGLPRRYFCDLLDDEVRARFDAALERLRRSGVRVDEVDIRHAPDAPAIYMHISLADAAAYHAATLESMPERYTPNVRLRLEMARHVRGEDYARALAGRGVLEREVDAALADRDALVVPTLPIPAPRLGEAFVDVAGRREPVRALMLRLTSPFNVTGHAALALPCGFTAAGLPCSLQLIGARGHTEALVRTALAVEAACTRDRS